MSSLKESRRTACQALRGAHLYAWNRTQTTGYDMFRTELLVAAGVGVVVFISDWINGTFLERLGAAVVTPLLGLFAAGVLLYLAALAWSPFRSHRELCAERDSLSLELTDARASDERFRRWLHLKLEAHKWCHGFANSAQQVQGAIRRPGEHFDLPLHLKQLRDTQERIRNRLTEIGQPELAERFTHPLEVLNGTKREYAELVVSLEQKARRIEYEPDPPPFEGTPPPEAMRMPNPYPMP